MQTNKNTKSTFGGITGISPNIDKKKLFQLEKELLESKMIIRLNDTEKYESFRNRGLYNFQVYFAKGQESESFKCYNIRAGIYGLHDPFNSKLNLEVTSIKKFRFDSNEREDMLETIEETFKASKRRIWREDDLPIINENALLGLQEVIKLTLANKEMIEEIELVTHLLDRFIYKMQNMDENDKKDNWSFGSYYACRLDYREPDILAGSDANLRIHYSDNLTLSNIKINPI